MSAGALTSGPAAAGLVVAGVVELAPPGVGGDEEGPLALDVGGDHVEGADAVDRDAERRAEYLRGHHAYPQAGVRAGADPDGDGRQVARRHARVGDDLGDRGREQLRVAVRVHGDELGQRLAAVVERHRDRGRGGVKSEQQHDQ